MAKKISIVCLISFTLTLLTLTSLYFASQSGVYAAMQAKEIGQELATTDRILFSINNLLRQTWFICIPLITTIWLLIVGGIFFWRSQKKAD